MKDIIRKKKDCLVLLFFGVVWLTSCETLVNNVPPDKLPSLEEKLVISSFISPQDTLVKVYVGLSSPLFSEYKSVNRSYSVFDGDTTFFGETPFVATAEVFLKNNSKEVQLKYNAREEYYCVIPSKSTIEILPDVTYELRVKFQNKTATAETRVPDMPISSFNMEIDTTFVKKSQYTSDYYLITSKLSFTTGIGGYFRFRGYATGTSSRINYTYPDKIVQEVVEDSRPINYENSGLVNAISQNEINTYNVTGRANMGGGTSYINGERIEPDDKPRIFEVYNEVMRVTESYYLYYESLQNYNDDNPFTEPTPIYSNITGGLGIFASSNRVGKRMAFK